MPRTVFDVEVNDEKFKKFLELYKEYRETLKEAPQDWAATGDAIADTGKGFEFMTAALLAQTELIHQQAAERRKADKEELAAAKAKTDEAKRLTDEEKARGKAAVEHQERVKQFLRDSGHLTVGIARTAVQSAEKLAKWAALSLGAGLVGGGVGLWGLDRLGESVAATRRTSMGLGISAGELQAFNVNYGSRLGLGTGFLETIQGAQSDLGKAGVFGQMGIPWAKVQNEDTAELTTDVIRRAHGLWRDAGPTGRNVQNMQANGLAGLGMDFRTWQTIGRQSEGDIEKWGAEYRRDVKTLNPSDPTQRAWTDFVTQLDRAGKQIERVFVNALQPLIDSGALPKLSVAIEHLVEKFFGNQNVIRWVDDFAKLISQTGDYLGSEKFQHVLKTFVDDIAYVASKIADVMKFLGLLPSSAGFPTGPNQEFNAADPALARIATPSVRQLALGDPMATYGFSSIEDTRHLPHGLLRGLASQESGITAHPRDTYDANEWHRGMFQMSDTMQHRLGVTDPYDVDQVSQAAGYEEGKYLERFHGNVAKAIAAWNEGPGAVERQEKMAAERGGDWFSYVSPGVKKYVQDVTAKAHMTLTVDVNNQTGAQVAVTANAVR